MREAARKREKREGVALQGVEVPKQRVLPLVEILVRAGEELRELVMRTGLQVFASMLEEDRECLCGARSAPDGERRAYRHGHDRGWVVLGGRKVTVPKPRVRDVAGKEIRLPSWEQMRAEDPLSERVLEQMMVGVSTRNYERSLEELPEEMPSVAVKKSSVSRRFVARTSRQVVEFLSRSLEELDFPVLMIDGTQMGEHVIVVALGVDHTGRKQVLGAREGTTESHGVCRALLRDLVQRGLVVERSRLVVTDGSKGIRKAVVSTFGQWACIQRCQLHKMRNVIEHLPKSQHEWMRKKLRDIFSSKDAEKGRAALRTLADGLEELHPGAAGSLREGVQELFTVTDLGLPDKLLTSLRSTNLVENLQGRLKTISRRVKRWRGGSMALRWAVSGFMEAEKKFRRIRGYQEMPTLLAALERRVINFELINEQKSA